MIPTTDLYLAPIPKRLSMREGVFNPNNKSYIMLRGDDPQSLIPAAKKSGLGWEITASPKAPLDQVGLIIHLDEDSGIPSEGYKLNIRPEKIEITASTPAGAFYGACTLSQILLQCGESMPCLLISDSPDYPARGVMLDVSRDKIPTMDTLYHLVDLLAGWKINQIQLYFEIAFAYPAHPVVRKGETPITGEQVLLLDAYCKERFIELVPNQNSFGHMERWLVHDEYRSMAEAPDGCDTIWGWREAFSLCPGDKRSLPFVRGLFDELLPHFSSNMFNVGLDETVDLGCVRSKEICERKGVGRVYLDFLLKIYSLVKQHDRTMMFWGDIVIKHPELIPDLPKDVIAIEWGYEDDHPYDEDCSKFEEAGLSFYVAPGTSGWNTLAGRTDNTVENITNAARNGLKHGAIGLLNTDWGDVGHWHPLPVSYLGYLAGAMASWNSKSDIKPDMAMNLSIHAFGDLTGKMGTAFHDLGNAYKAFKKLLYNSSVPWQMLFTPPDDEYMKENLTIGEFEELRRRLDQIAESVCGEEMTAPDADIVREEFPHVLAMLRLAEHVGKCRLGAPGSENIPAAVEALKKEHARIWLLRNRPGGLSVSTGKIKVG